MTTTLYHGDCLTEMDKIEAGSVDTIITDPPYGLNFMSASWDHGVPGVPFWEAALRVAKPGAMLLAFGGTRTHHRLMCAIEDAGWVIRDCLMWLYGQGFNKVGQWQNNKAFKRLGIDKDWHGWGGSLKPAWEPIILAMKPLDGTFAHNALTHGVAGLWVDGGRISTSDDDPNRRDNPGRILTMNKVYGAESRSERGPTLQQGRWPANLILSHSPDCKRVGVRKVKSNSGSVSGKEPSHTGDENTSCYGEYQRIPFNRHADPDGTETVPAWECVEGCPVAMLDEQSGVLKSGGGERRYNGSGFMGDRPSQIGKVWNGSTEPNTGGASRFFYCSKAPKRERWFYCPECDNAFPMAEREGHQHGHEDFKHLFTHPTQKPLSLMRYLCKLTKTPAGGVILDNFSGTGTTAEAAILEGRDVIAIERDYPAHVIAKRRAEAAQSEMVQLELG